MKKVFILLMIAAFVVASLTALAARPPQGQLYYNGQLYHTLVPPDHVPDGTGLDTLYQIAGQPSVICTAPGAPRYHGGRWAIFTTSWSATPYTITSCAQLDSAVAAGDITATRAPQLDNRCPVQPGAGGGNDR